MDVPIDLDEHLVTALPLLGVAPGSAILVAFSGGPDSTALLWGLHRAREAFDLRLTAVHVDHGLDRGSAARARVARRLAEVLGIDCAVETLAAPPPPGESLEAWARRQRYAILDRHAATFDPDAFVATAHHADDQAETVVLRLLFGSGLAGLAGIRPRLGRRIRPLLDLRRTDLQAAARRAVVATGIEWIEDPTNLDPRRPRNRIRHHLLDELRKGTDDLERRLTAIADAARRAVPRMDRLLLDRIDASPVRFPVPLPIPRASKTPVQFDRPLYESLPPVLRPRALGAVERLAGRIRPTPSSARGELSRQLAEADHPGCDAGDGWRWHGDARRLRLLPPVRPVGRFTYTLEIPGSVAIPEIDLELVIEIGPVADWMFHGHGDKTALAPLPAFDPSQGSTERATARVRNRRPGDRIRPLGRRGSKRLKDLLIDHRIPRELRDHLPLLIVEDTVAWVPGVTIDHRFRITKEPMAWIARLRPLSPPTPASEAAKRPVTEKTEKGRTP